MPDWLHHLYSPQFIRDAIAWGGLLALTGIIFAETGILAGFFLPGDSLLVTAGVCCALDPSDPSAPPLLSLPLTLGVLAAAAILGDWVNFWFGRATGNRVWSRPDGRFFKRRYLEEARDFYARWGGPALAVARFIPIARTFVPFAAGMARMPFAAFMWWNIGGAALWVVSLVLLGWKLAQYETMRRNLHLLILAVVAVSLVPLGIGVLRRLLRRAAPV